MDKPNQVIAYWASAIQEASLAFDHVHHPKCSIALVLATAKNDGVRPRHDTVVAHGLDHACGFENKSFGDVEAGHVKSIDRLMPC
jgi:hypothetical protein